MKTHNAVDKLIDDYLARLDRALRGLPSARRLQIVEEVSSHIADGRASLDDENESSIRALLERVGDPRVIAEEAGADRRSAPRTDAWVAWLVLFGAFPLGFVTVPYGIGWIVGVCFLWRSPTWRVRDKLIGTFVLPGGLFGATTVLLGSGTSSRTCSGSSPVGGHAVMHCVTSGPSIPLPAGIALLVIVLIAPILTAFHLQRVRRRF